MDDATVNKKVQQVVMHPMTPPLGEVLSHVAPCALTVISSVQAIGKRTIDYSGTYVTWIVARRSAACVTDLPCMPKPRIIDSLAKLPPCAMLHLPASNIPSKFVNSGFTKGPNPIMAACWTPGYQGAQHHHVGHQVMMHQRAILMSFTITPPPPPEDGRRCVVGTGGGEYSLWVASTLFTESVIAGLHDGAAIRSICFTHNQQVWNEAGFRFKCCKCDWQGQHGSDPRLIQCKQNFIGSDDKGRVRIFKPNFEMLSQVQVWSGGCGESMISLV